MDMGLDEFNAYREILRIRPRQKAVIARGYAETDRVRQAQELSAGSYVKKPYALHEINEAVKNELVK